ncbi:spore germination lipoprotein GerD [Salipaludibacillus neizhouensis]|uniref:spore germination lipoprotein GerD n=1 Tax=Salipaludibacillus neizhouensis TaxID=885475 RepID=UPI0015FF41E8|nr:spore germination lipoprotein GerD [Salipaludibacillus neizhouensis]
MKRLYINKTILFIFSTLCLSFFIVGCADNTGQEPPDYEKTKEMMVDMLQTEEGKKAVREILQDEKVKEELVMEQEFIKDTIQTTLASEEGKKYWQEVMKDPEFSKTFATSMQEENEKLLKDLMKDPEYQKMMAEILKDPALEKNYVELMKSADYRKEVMNVVTEAMESPFFVARVNELLTEIAKKELQSSEGGGGESKKEDGG